MNGHNLDTQNTAKNAANVIGAVLPPPHGPRPAPAALSVRTKLMAVLLSLFLILAFSAAYLHNTLNESLKIIERQASAIQTLEQVTRSGKVFTNLRWTCLTFLGAPVPSNFKAVEEKLQDFENSMAPLHQDTLAEDIASVNANIVTLRDDAGKLMKAERAGGDISSLESDITKTLGQIDETLNGSVIKLEEVLSDTAAASREQTGALHMIPVVFTLGGVMTIVFAGLVAMVQIFIPIGRITRAISMAGADTANARDYVLPVPRNDEMGRAAHALNTLLNEVSDGIDHISAAERRLRESGQYMQAVMDNMVDGVVTLNEGGRIETFSASAEKLFRRDARGVIGAHVSTLLFDRQGAPFDLIAHLDVHEGGDRQWAPMELMARTSEGTLVLVELTVGRTGYAGRVLYIATLRDVAARKQMENFLEQAHRMETVGRMTGGIAHDFNNMLTVISGNFELIERRIKDDDPLLRSMISMGLGTVRKGKEMTQRLLAISSRQLLKPEVISLRERLPAIVEMIGRAVREDVELTTVVPDGLWNIRVDPVQFESALLNLAINARDAMPGQGGRIVIEAANVVMDEDPKAGTSPGPYVMITMTDNGRGIPASILHRIFEPFFTTKSGSKGTGLGLSMVYGFARQSGGHITIESSENKGASVKLYFPRSEEQSIPATPDGRQEDEPDPTGDESIMVVEDRPDVLQYVAQTLRELGYTVISASGAGEALDKMRNKSGLDLLLTDVVMPGEMNGEDLAHEALHRLPSLKVLYMSGYTRDALQEQGALKKGVHLLSKPFTRADLAWLVRKVLDADQASAASALASSSSSQRSSA